METVSTTKNDMALRVEFADMVRAVELAADRLARSWRITCGLLAAALVVTVCWRQNK